MEVSELRLRERIGYTVFLFTTPSGSAIVSHYWRFLPGCRTSWRNLLRDMSAHEHTPNGHEPDLTLEVLRAGISDEQNAGGPRTLHLGVVENLKDMSQHRKENFWFVNPGSIIECDGCERFMERASGTSAGALGRSMFAQRKWLCNDCLSRQETGFSSPTGSGGNWSAATWTASPSSSTQQATQYRLEHLRRLRHRLCCQ